MRKHVMRGAVLVAVVTAGVAATDARQDKCRTVAGTFKAKVVEGPPCKAQPKLVCTDGKVEGDLRGQYLFTMGSMQPADSSVPTINFFAGRSTITLETGDTLDALDAGTIDFAAGGFASLITVTSGSGSAAGTTGQLRITGIFDPKAHTTEGEYRGSVCTK